MQLYIPADADRRVKSGLNSFSGKMLNNKVISSYIYNLGTQTIGRDANNLFGFIFHQID